MNEATRDVEMHGQAERWFLRLQAPDCTPAERAAAQRWRAQDPAHEAAYRQVETIWHDTGDLAGDDAIAQALREAERPSPVRTAPRAWRWLPAGALAAAAIVLVALFVPGPWRTAEPPPGTRYTTALGEQRTVALADGSTVVLDTSTVLVERYGDDLRRIDLQQGRADFQVRPDANMPFVVYAAGGEVTAIGTRFQVQVRNAAATVTLLEGVVKVEAPERADHPRNTATLSPGQRLAFDGTSGRWNTDTIDLEAARGWTEGNLFARNWRLADLLAEMNRYSDTQLRLADPGLADLPISGTFRVGDQASLVLALENGWSLQASRPADGEIVLERVSPTRR